MQEIVKALLNLSGELKEIKASVGVLRKTQLQQFSENWIDGQEIMLSLKISKRTLQTLRDSGTLPFSRINGKFYYKVSDLEMLLENSYSKTLKSKSHELK
jgi:hypothetical protein